MTGSSMTLVPHTHWDREWYQPLDQFLERLVEMMDGLIEVLDRDPRFAHFHLDGQTAMIDDYLTIRPEKEPDIRRLAAAGRISVGPWFTQMDEFLVSGESHIRNLDRGLARARDLSGDPALAPPGYLPDQFGHIGQMPQVLRHGGLDRAMVWRGVPQAIDRTAFRWESPDGSAVTTEYLMYGYSLGMMMNQTHTAEELRTALEQAERALEPYSVRDRLLVTVGSDHHAAASQLPALVAEVQDADGAKVEIGSLREYLRDGPRDDLPVWRGELRSSARAHLLPNVVSSRVHQKVARAQAELELERWAEPFSALVPGVDWPAEELEEAWRLLLWNGAHDSVCGCGVDEVARDVDERNRRASAIADSIRERALDALAARMPRPGTVWVNPSPFERSGVPGLGWKLDADVPVYPSPAFAVEDGRILANGFTIRLVDEGDVGDLYTFCPTEAAPAVGPARVQVREGMGSVEAAFDEGLRVRLEGERDPDGSTLWLHLGISNGRPDHRLRLHVALDGPAAGSVALAPFEVVERPIASEGGTETPSATWPASGAVMAGGVAILAEHVFEYEVLTDPPELAVTLLRCVGSISRPNLATRPWPAGPDIATPLGQMIGEHQVTMILQRGLRPDELPSARERACLAMHATRAPGDGDWPDEGSLLDVRGAELSSVRRVDGTLQVRIWSPSMQPRQASVGDRELTLGPARFETIVLP